MIWVLIPVVYLAIFLGIWLWQEAQSSWHEESLGNGILSFFWPIIVPMFGLAALLKKL